jgi:hypothetical protein
VPEPTVPHPNLHREYFADIAAGKKRTEYRDATPYWKRRLEGEEKSRVFILVVLAGELTWLHGSEKVVT